MESGLNSIELGIETSVEEDMTIEEERDLHMEILERLEIRCEDVARLMGEYADNGLTQTLKSRLDHHIKKCDDCREFRREYLLTIQIANELPEIPVTTDIHNRLREGLNKRLGINLPLIKE